MNTVDISVLHEFLDCYPNSGELFWKTRQDHHFKAVWAAKRWNKLYAEKRAFTFVQLGYLSAPIQGKTMLAHRVIWAMQYGKFPDLFLDHIDGNRKNNAIGNLREADCIINGRNRAVGANSSTKVIGVTWSKQREAYRAYIHADGKQTTIGHYPTIEAAAIARQQASEAFGFHKNHGRI